MNMPTLNTIKLPIKTKKTLSLPEKLHFFNGLGGFTADGTEYIINLVKVQNTSSPLEQCISESRFWHDWYRKVAKDIPG